MVICKPFGFACARVRFGFLQAILIAYKIQSNDSEEFAVD